MLEGEADALGDGIPTWYCMEEEKCSVYTLFGAWFGAWFGGLVWGFVWPPSRWCSEPLVGAWTQGQRRSLRVRVRVTYRSRITWIEA